MAYMFLVHALFLCLLHLQAISGIVLFDHSYTAANTIAFKVWILAYRSRLSMFVLRQFLTGQPSTSFNLHIHCHSMPTCMPPNNATACII